VRRLVLAQLLCVALVFGHLVCMLFCLVVDAVLDRVLTLCLVDNGGEAACEGLQPVHHNRILMCAYDHKQQGLPRCVAAAILCMSLTQTGLNPAWS
jgi:hypothetical protein